MIQLKQISWLFVGRYNFVGFLPQKLRFRHIPRNVLPAEFYQAKDYFGEKVIQALQSVLEHVLITVAGL